MHIQLNALCKSGVIRQALFRELQGVVLPQTDQEHDFLFRHCLGFTVKHFIHHSDVADASYSSFTSRHHWHSNTYGITLNATTVVRFGWNPSVKQTNPASQTLCCSLYFTSFLSNHQADLDSTGAWHLEHYSWLMHLIDLHNSVTLTSCFKRKYAKIWNQMMTQVHENFK